MATIPTTKYAEITESKHMLGDPSDPVYLMLWKEGPLRGLLVQNNGHPLQIEDQQSAIELQNGRQVSHLSYRDYYSQYVGKVEVVALVRQAWTYAHINENNGHVRD